MENKAKRFLRLLLAIAMVMAIVPMTFALATETDVAEVNGTKYATLQAAINAAQAGDTVTLLKDVSLTSALTINKPITIDGGKHTLTSNQAANNAAAVKITAFEGELVIKNLTIDAQITKSYTRAVNISGDATNRTITLNAVEIKGTAAYAVNMQRFGGNTTVNIQNSTITNWNVLNVYSAVTINVENSDLTAHNTLTGNNDYMAVAIFSPGVTLNIDEKSSLTVSQEEGKCKHDVIVLYTYQYGEVLNANSNINIAPGATITKIDPSDPVVYVTAAKAQIKREDGTVMFDTLEEAIAALTFNDNLDQLESLTSETFTEEQVNAKLEELGRDFHYVEGEAQSKVKVAEVNGVQYATLAEAIEKATAGQTITFLTDITENVTINKSVTIDGANFKYTGKMTTMKVDLTVTKVNFVKGTVFKDKSAQSGGAGGTYKFTFCNFDGQGLLDYAINLNHTSNIIIEDCTMKDYAAFLQVPSSNTSISIKNVEVDAIYYGFKIDYSGSGDSVIMENVTVNAGEYALYHSNYGTKNHIIKNCTFNGGVAGIHCRNEANGIVNTFKFEGNNTVSSMSNSQYVKYVLTAGATLTAPEGYDVTTNVNGMMVVYDGGVYKLVKYVAAIGDVKYESLQAAINAAKDGDTIKLLVDIEHEGAVVISDTTNITLNLNGHVLTAGAIRWKGGNVIDEAKSTGGVKLTNINNIELGANNTYMPIYDSAKGYYRFFNYEMESFEPKTSGTVAQFGMALRFEVVEAYELIADSRLSLEYAITFMYQGEKIGVKYTYSDLEKFAEWAQNAGAYYAKYPYSEAPNDYVLILTVGGLQKLDAETFLEVQPTVNSKVTNQESGDVSTIFSASSAVMKVPAVTVLPTDLADPTKKDEEENGGATESGESSVGSDA